MLFLSMVTTKAPSSLPVTLCKRDTKHIDIWYHYIREVAGAKKVVIMFVPGEMNPANIFTKNLGKIKFIKFQNQLGLDFKDSPNLPANSLWCLHCLKWHAALAGTKHGGVLNELHCVS